MEGRRRRRRGRRGGGGGGGGRRRRGGGISININTSGSGGICNRSLLQAAPAAPQSKHGV